MNKTFEEFKKLKEENIYEAKKYLMDCWKTDKLMAFVDEVKVNPRGNKFAFLKPSNWSNNNITNPFNNKAIYTCYVNLNDAEEDVTNKWIIFDFHVNNDEKLDENNLISGSFVDVLKSYNDILNEYNINIKSKDNIKDANIPNKMYKFFKEISEDLTEEIVSKNNEIEKLK